jgi:short-subunit dehydrogenase
MPFKTILVAGASRGIGLAVAEHLASQSHRLFTVSRTPASIGEWIQADLSNLAGVVHSLREELRSQQIGVTVINPGNVGTPEVLADLAANNLLGGEAIPLQDLLSIIDCILSLSRATCIKEIDVPAMLGEGA